MKYTLLITIFLLNLFYMMGQNNTHKPTSKKTLVWSEEFDYIGFPDPTKWSFEEGFIRNREPQYYTAKRLQNAFVNDGVLIISAHKEAYKNAQFTSASIHTKGKFEFTYGRLEVRAKIPKGSGVWPAIWTLGTNINESSWPLCGEIDIMEFWGHNPSTIQANVHTKLYNHAIGKGRGGEISVEKPWEDFHIFAVEWYPDRMDFYFDSTLYYSCKKKNEGIGEWPFDAPQYLLINHALIADIDKIDENIFPSRYYIDYVRYYKLE